MSIGFSIEHGRFPFIPPERRETKGKLPDNTKEIIFSGWNPREQGKREVICSGGNGYMGARAAIDRPFNNSTVHMPAFYVEGVFAQRPQTPEEKAASLPVLTDLVRGPDWQFATLSVSGVRLDIEKGKEDITQYQQGVDMQSGTSWYGYSWQTPEGKINVHVDTIFSHDKHHLALQRYTLTPESDMHLSFTTGIFGDVPNNGISYYDDAKAEKAETKNVLTYVGHTADKDTKIALASTLQVEENGRPFQLSSTVLESPTSIEQAITLPLRAGATYTIDKFVGVFTSLDGTLDPKQKALQTVQSATSYDTEFAHHKEVLARQWDASGIFLSGDDSMQQRINYATYKLLNFAWEGNGFASIGAKGLDNKPGDGYMGHVFWDTEIYLLPFYIMTQPETARALLTYRFITLPAAKEKAQTLGYDGALFAWESADTGKEVTPEFVRDDHGNSVEVLTGKNELHISADIAYAMNMYVQATGDTEFMQRYGAEVIGQTARFWVSKALHDTQSDETSYHIRHVIGPDEYHERNPFTGEAGVDDNYFTNAMARWNIQKALQLAEDPRYAVQIGLTPEEKVCWQKVVSNIFLPQGENGLPESFAGANKLIHVDLQEPRYQEIPAMDMVLREEIAAGKREGPHTKYDVKKQMDLLLYFILMGDTNNVAFKMLYDQEVPLTSHGSSLSDAPHVIAAHRIGDQEKALEHLHKATGADLDDTKGNIQTGTHAAAMGGVWAAMVFGFGGVTLQKGGALQLAPRLPETWNRLAFKLRQKGIVCRVDVTSDGVLLQAVGGPRGVQLPVAIYGKQYTVGVGDTLFFPNPE